MSTSRAVLILGLSLSLTRQGLPQQSGPAVHQLGKTSIATSMEHLASVEGIRQLSDGRVLVNDPTGRRLLLFDSTLTKVTVVADSTGAVADAYPGRSNLMAYGADSSLLLDSRSQAMLVIDPGGRIVRTEALPVPADFAAVLNSTTAQTATLASAQSVTVDPLRGLPYQGVMRACGRSTYREPGLYVTGVCPAPPDTLAPIVRAERGAPIPDTLGYVRLPQTTVLKVDSAGNTISLTNPLPAGDDWAATSDGWVALIRSHDYHIDWVGPDGSRLSSPKLPFDWHRLSDSEKVAIVDSVLAGRPGLGRVAPAGKIRGVVAATDLQDYRPPFRPRTACPDADGNVWVRTTPNAPADGGPVYDVVSRTRGLIDRVQIRSGLKLVGFGPGVVYLTSLEATGLVLMRARIH